LDWNKLQKKTDEPEKRKVKQIFLSCDPDC